MVIIAGLGNPGKKYEKTRHNTGFMVVDKIADKYNIEVSGLNDVSFYEAINVSDKAHGYVMGIYPNKVIISLVDISIEVVPGDVVSPEFTIKNKSTVATNMRIMIECSNLDTDQYSISVDSNWVNDGNYFYYKAKDDTTADNKDAIAANTPPTAPVISVSFVGDKITNEDAGKSLQLKITWQVKQDANIAWENIGSFEIKTA